MFDVAVLKVDIAPGDGGDDMLLILAVPGESVVGSLRIGTGD